MDRFRLMPSYRYYDTEGTSPLTLPESAGKSLRDYKIYGNSVQDGEPTPENPAQVQCVGDKTKNLFDITWVTENANEAYIELDRETLVLKNYACQTGMTPERFLELTGLSEGDTVTTSHTKKAVLGETNTISGRILFYLQGSSSSGFILTANGNKRSSVIPENFNSENYQPMMIYGCKEADENGSQIMNISDLMITTDSEAEYEPYGYKIPVTNGGKNLFDPEAIFPDYANEHGGITYTNNDYKVIHTTKILEGEFKENTQYTLSLHYEITNNSDSTNTVVFIMWDTEGVSLGSSKPVSVANGSSSGDITLTSKVSSSVGYIDFSYYSHTNEASIILSDIQIEEGDTATDYEPYREPETYNIYLDEPLAEGEYIDFINQKAVRSAGEETVSLPTIKTHKGTNIITVGTEVEPSNIKVQYYK